jgi:hypothetical protein
MSQPLVPRNEDTINTTLLTSQSYTWSFKPGAEVSLSVTVQNTAPAAQVFTAAVTDICTAAAHGMVTGLKVQLTTVTTLPAPLQLATDYFVIALDANTFKLATSLANALVGTAINITDTGTGAHTITPVSSGTRSFIPSFSVDGTNFSSSVRATSDTPTTYSAVTITTNAVSTIYTFSILKGITALKLALTLDNGQTVTSIKVTRAG